jgi:hypothetical protein
VDGVTEETTPRTIGDAFGAETSPPAAAESDLDVDGPQATPGTRNAIVRATRGFRLELASTAAPRWMFDEQSSHVLCSVRRS